MRDEQRYGEALGQVLELTVLLHDDMTRELARQGLTESRAHLVWELQQRGPTTQRVLAEALGVSPRNVTGLVDALVATGFVTRAPHPTDRRATLVCFTEHGAAAASELVEGHRELGKLLFSGMSDRTFDGFVDGMGEVLMRLREELARQEGERS